ncbi:MAG: copper chaperone PCu(A)C [Gemmatimonadetes bacterium]|nr:copper chaperone PCu(A)C [Gemmatimonadota bacterium]MBL0178530.1 copper chaperone PCu(A)C [Gemmatimonadota bacterium]
MTSARLLLLLLCTTACGAAEGPLRVSRLEVSMAPVGAVAASGYFVLRNAGALADTLDRVTTPAADSVTIHESMDHGDGQVMMMPLTWVAVPAGDSVVFALGGRHLMLEHFPTPLAVGSAVTLTFHFRSGRTITQSTTVHAVGGKE